MTERMNGFLRRHRWGAIVVTIIVVAGTGAVYHPAYHGSLTLLWLYLTWASIGFTTYAIARRDLGIWQRDCIIAVALALLTAGAFGCGNLVVGPAAAALLAHSAWRVLRPRGGETS